MKPAQTNHGRKRRPALCMSLIATVLAMSAAMASCAAPPNVVPTGHVTGVVQIRGGVIPPTPVEAKVTATLVGGAGGTSYTSDTADDGSFTFDLPAGTYELSAVLTKRNIGDQATPQAVTVASGAAANVPLFVNYP